MSEQNPNPDPTDDQQVTDDDGSDRNDGNVHARPQDGDLPAANREAAMRRRQLREVEAERDALRSRLDDRDRQEVQRLATDRLADPDDLWLSTSLDAMRADDGTIDTDKAAAELERVLSEKPHWARKATPSAASFHAGPRGGVSPEPPSFGATVKRALRGG